MGLKRQNTKGLLSTMAVGAFALIVGSQGALAEPMSFTGQNEDGWRHSVTGYAFLPARTGTTVLITARTAATAPSLSIWISTDRISGLHFTSSIVGSSRS